jgi:hypothetical protein
VVGGAGFRPSSASEPKADFRETDTLAVSAHGALVLLAMEVFAGDQVTLGNLQTDEQQPARVVYLGPQRSEKQQVGIEFVKASPLFWRIAFPPSDWTTEHEDAKPLAKQIQKRD